MEKPETSTIQKSCNQKFDWFYNPVSLDQYKENYIRWLGGRLAKMPSLLVKAVDSFESVDDCTIHIVAHLTDYSISTLNKRITKGKIDNFGWMKPKYSVGRYFVLSRSSLLSALDEEQRLYHSTSSIGLAATKLGVGYQALSSLKLMTYTSRYKKYCSLLPLIILPVSGSRHICNRKIEAFLSSNGYEGKPFIKSPKDALNHDRKPALPAR